MIRIAMTMPEERALEPGERILACAVEGSGFARMDAGMGPALPVLRAGTLLRAGGGAALLVLGSGFRHAPAGEGARLPCLSTLTLEARTSIPAGARLEVSPEKCGWSVAWITLSDKGSRGEREDTAGPLAAELLAARLETSLCTGFILPDEEPRLRALLADLALVQGYDLIVTSGGTGVGPRDVTPEAALKVIEKRLPGFERAMTAASLAKTPHGAISRALAGTLGESLILNLPGSPKAVRECLEPVLPALDHALRKLQGDKADCATVVS
ncbi:MAG: molybdenum cofactor biosynthesis protein B [Desulfovibrionaceae bacterium]